MHWGGGILINFAINNITIFKKLHVHDFAKFITFVFTNFKSKALPRGVLRSLSNINDVIFFAKIVKRENC